MERLSTGTSGLDRLLKGGFALRQINLVYGEASTGKTVLAMQSALGAAARGFKVFFVDADLSFSVQRLESLDRGSWLIAPVATRTLRHWSYLILRLRPTPRHDVRECLLEKIDGREARGQRALFRIGESGLEDV